MSVTIKKTYDTFHFRKSSIKNINKVAELGGIPLQQNSHILYSTQGHR